MVGNTDAAVRQAAATADRSDAVLTSIVAALAEVWATDDDEVWSRLQSEGLDLVVDSKDAEVIVSIVEEVAGRDLVRVEDLEPEKLTTVAALRDLLASASRKNAN